jgi:hypothetical protein
MLVSALVILIRVSFSALHSRMTIHRSIRNDNQVHCEQHGLLFNSVAAAARGIQEEATAALILREPYAWGVSALGIRLRRLTTRLYFCR